jgi:2-dehydropantoate 2-reductase
MGGLLAASGGAEVWLIHRRPAHVQAIRSGGLVISRDGQEQTVSLGATTDPAEVGPVDVVVLLVKGYDTRIACQAALPLLRPDTLVITFQNGLGNLETIGDVLGPERAVLGVTFQGATLDGPGRVADRGRGPTFLAARPDTRARLERLAQVFKMAGIDTQVLEAEKVDGLLWGKLAMVAGINPVAAILRVPNGALGSVEACRAVSLEAIREARAVAEAKGVRLAFDPCERFEATTRATAQMSSGTLLDALRGRRTEVDAISGAIASEGKRLGVATPVNHLLWSLVKAIEATHDARVTLEPAV